MSKWNNNAKEKSNQILKQITPVLENYFDGKLFSTECEDSELGKILDYRCAIDALILKDNDVFGIAHRVDYKNKQSITIRYMHSETTKPTEFQKITNWSKIKPTYHVTTCCVDGKPKYIAIIPTLMLLEAIIDDGIGELKNGIDGSQYFELKWYDLRKYGLHVLKLEV